jgi:hypothetical protein
VQSDDVARAKEYSKTFILLFLLLFRLKRRLLCRNVRLPRQTRLLLLWCLLSVLIRLPEGLVLIHVSFRIDFTPAFKYESVLVLVLIIGRSMVFLCGV